MKKGYEVFQKFRKLLFYSCVFAKFAKVASLHYHIAGCNRSGSDYQVK